MIRIIQNLILLSVMLTIVGGHVFAAQQKTVKTRDTVTLDLSSMDPNIVAVTNDRIKKYSVVKGVATASIDSELGILNVKPAGAYNDKPFSMLIFTENGARYTLLFVPKKIPAQDIVLTNLESGDIQGNGVHVSALYTTKIADLIKAMIKDETLAGFKKEMIVPSKSDLKLYLLTKYNGADYTGEVVVFKNLSDAVVTLKEREFAAANVVAIAISDVKLQPFATTKIYRVVKNG